MHPLAPSSTHVLVDQTELVRKRRRRGGLRPLMMIRLTVVAAAMTAVAGGVVWLKHESPHLQAAEAARSSPLLSEARSLQPLLETTKPAGLAAYAMKRTPHEAAVTDARPAVFIATPPPVWLMTEAVGWTDATTAALSREQTIEQLRQQLRDRGARQMQGAVRFAMLNVGELLALNSNTWASCMATAAASQTQSSAMLLSFYLCHLDRDGDGAGVRALLHALELGMPEGQAVSTHILAGRGIADLEREMSQAFDAAGVELQFVRHGGAAFQPR